MLKQPSSKESAEQAAEVAEQAVQDQCAPMREMVKLQQERQPRGPGFWQSRGRVCPNAEFYNERIKPREELAQQIITNSMPGDTDNYGFMAKSLFLGPNEELKKTCLYNVGEARIHGIDFASKIINGIKFQIWDTAGQGRFRTITQSYFNGAHILILFAKDQDEFATTKAMIEGTVKDIVKSNIIMILAKPQNTTIDFNDFPISGEINITPDCKNEKFITLIYDVIKKSCRT